MGRKVAAVVFSLGCLQASSALALGLGELKLQSNLNEPLEASVDLLNMGELHHDEVKIRLGTREDFNRLGIDRSFFLTSIQFEVIVDDNGRGRIVMTTEDPVLEPYLDFIVEARWPTGRLLREYTILIDPPTFADTTAVTVSASERVEEVEGIPAPAKKKAEAGAASGTGVDVRKSDLAPGGMPERRFNAAAAQSPAAGGRYMVSRDDTLWQIAMQAKPEGVSVHQTMLDIQRLNPDAFINNNINRVKAGYIIYLPSAEDISSENLASALAQVREQNEAWRQGRDAELAAAAGPSLRISADVEDGEAPVTDVDAADHRPGSAALTDRDADGAAPTGDADARIAAMEDRVETLQRIVDLKDDQIAALQAALADAQAEADEISTAREEGEPAPDSLDADATADGDGDPAAGQRAETATEPGAEPEPQTGTAAEAERDAERAVAAERAAPVATRDAPESSGGLLDYLWYALGAAVLALLAFVMLKRRGAQDEAYEDPKEEVEDVFSSVELKDQELAVEEEAPVPVAPSAPQKSPSDGRGYGERRHDAYASDVEASDALAEADIYIAYGRHPQAIDLLNNALKNGPDNPVYRLKLLEIYTELNDRGAAMKEFERIRSGGDSDSIARAEELLMGLDAGQRHEPAVEETGPARTADDGPGLAPNPLELVDEGDQALESDFSDLEIESSGRGKGDDEELDLSADFEPDEDEELVIAADSNGLSTKLDLARAYLDMGDEDGARQILDEIVAEGNDELKAEARALLDRIG